MYYVLFYWFFQQGQKGGNVAARYADMKVSKISTLTTSHSQKVAQFHKHLMQNVGPVLEKLQVVIFFKRILYTEWSKGIQKALKR